MVRAVFFRAAVRLVFGFVLEVVISCLDGNIPGQVQFILPAAVNQSEMRGMLRSGALGGRKWARWGG
jgi:hypothetical protein